MAEFTKERIIEELKSSTQNASGMFEISEDTICALMSMLADKPSPAYVPDEIPEPDTARMFFTDAVVAIAKVQGWNACRAAMLQGKSEQPQNAQQNIPENIPGGNSPVIPDGWISCSERMPEMGERQCYVLAADFKNNYPPNIPNTQVGVYGDCFNDGNPTWDDGDGEDLYLKEVTHWMPLPEPPQEMK
ncbi:TPA: DUF551 domain-containing protein [Escherichia coli]|uniref:DUF551 domain-containing protein n=2 Tax=Escherichia coli TaxID=562 RepID=UPI000FDB1F61|nr:DUF551 domain-containing protein [Escherichia coli]NPN29040.1 DUF551 domain-containing protein [Escherichia coli]RVT30668.1 DUF551 domain-containing protein [Escherichia coli]HAI5826872.1 DUF551 domain-containing protein [Escherichia coli]HAJ5491904.1 DUF551 domain-containing protein [Escherichia coli]HAJ5493277.1 DUF551 domain-containing protein [Escherichia coli]